MANAPPTKFSLSIGGSKKPTSGTSLREGKAARSDKNAFNSSRSTPTKRALDGSDNEDDDEHNAQPQKITSFGPGLNEPKPEPKKALVIPAQQNRDWREQAKRKRQRSGIPASSSSGKAGGGAGGDNDDEGGTEEGQGVKGMPTNFGLTVKEKKKEPEGEANGGGEIQEQATTTAEGTDTDAQNGESSQPPKERTADEEAMARLLGEKHKSNLVVPIVNSEEEAFQRDVEEAPDMASLDAYAAMPIEEFGSALLRGMGWKEGQSIGRKRGQASATTTEVKPRVIQRRQALLGIGAKENAAAGIELGAWGKGAKGGGARNIIRQEYTPVIMKNSKTGEQLTEEELKKKLEQQTLDDAEKSRDSRRKSSRDRDSEYRSSEKSSSRRHKDDDYDERRSSRRDGERRRDRSRDRDREKEKERERNRDRDRDRDTDRDRDRERQRESDSRSKYKSSSRRDRSASADGRDHHRRRRDRSTSRDKHHRRDRDDRKDEQQRYKDRRPRDGDRNYEHSGSSRHDRRD